MKFILFLLSLLCIAVALTATTALPVILGCLLGGIGLTLLHP